MTTDILQDESQNGEVSHPGLVPLNSSVLAPLTLLLFLPEGDHLIQLSLDQPVPLVLVQPHPARKRLLDARERTVHHHLRVRAVCVCVCWWMM